MENSKYNMKKMFGNFGELSLIQYAHARDAGYSYEDMACANYTWYQKIRETILIKKNTALESQYVFIEKHLAINRDQFGYNECRHLIRGIALADGIDERYIEHINAEQEKSIKKKSQTAERVRKHRAKDAPADTLPESVLVISSCNAPCNAPVTLVKRKTSKRIGFEFAQSALKKILANNGNEVSVTVDKVELDEIWDATEEAIQGMINSPSFKTFFNKNNVDAVKLTDDEIWERTEEHIQGMIDSPSAIGILKSNVVPVEETDEEIWARTEEAIQGIRESASYRALVKSRFGSI